MTAYLSFISSFSGRTQLQSHAHRDLFLFWFLEQAPKFCTGNSVYPNSEVWMCYPLAALRVSREKWNGLCHKIFHSDENIIALGEC